jgi:Xaa-Pro dipeptidase
MRFGTAGVDFEARVDFARLRRERLDKAKAALRAGSLGALVCYDFDNIRYITGTSIGEWCRNKMNRYCILPRDAEPLLFDPATPAKKLACPWIADRVFPAVGSMRGAIPEETGSVDRVADDMVRRLCDYGVERQPVGLDIADIPLVRALERRGLEVVDGQQTMLAARMVKTRDEIELLKAAAALADAAYDEVVRAIRPGVRENELVAVANYHLYRLGSDLVECVNSVSGERGRPHPHTFSDRIIRPGDMIYLDIMHSYLGYRTCYYRTFVCGKPTAAQIEAHATAWKWLRDSIAAVKPGATTADVARAWPAPDAYGLQTEDEAFLLQFGHGVGLSIWEKPVISRLFSLQHPYPIQEGMVFALETYCPSADGKGAARIEEEVVVTPEGCERLFRYPVEELIACGVPGA